jgi:hypothetical protein
MANIDNAVQGSEVVVLFREAGTSDAYKTLVCEIDNQFELTNDTTETDTKCGTYVGIKDPKGTISGNAVYNVDTEATEISYSDVAAWQKANTLLDYKYINLAFDSGAGAHAEAAVVSHTGQGRFSQSQFKGTNGEVGQFSWTFKPTTIV